MMTFEEAVAAGRMRDVQVMMPEELHLALKRAARRGGRDGATQFGVSVEACRRLLTTFPAVSKTMSVYSVGVTLYFVDKPRLDSFGCGFEVEADSFADAERQALAADPMATLDRTARPITSGLILSHFTIDSIRRRKGPAGRPVKPATTYACEEL